MLEYLPNREAREVTIDGFAVPRIEAKESTDGLHCDIRLDGRFGAMIPAELAQEVIWLLANALAIGAGYSCHGENSVVTNPFKVRVMEIGATK
jgi:hypothetical protein